jgi:hypothetical protein
LILVVVHSDSNSSDAYQIAQRFAFPGLVGFLFDYVCCVLLAQSPRFVWIIIMEKDI